MLHVNNQMLELSALKSNTELWLQEFKLRIYIITLMALAEIVTLCKFTSNFIVNFSTTSGGLNNPSRLVEYRQAFMKSLR